MLTRTRILALSLALMLVLSACAGGAFGGFGSVTEEVDSQSVVRTMAYYDRGDLGDIYEISLTVPESWVDSYETTNNGSALTFKLVKEGQFPATIFQIFAMNRSQYWEQSGSYPGDYINLTQVDGTYFVYYAPVFATYSGLDADAYAALLEEVEDVLSTLEITEAN